jgi:hypothetical protein
MIEYSQHTKRKQHIELLCTKVWQEKGNLFQKIPLYNSRRYKTLSTLKKENLKTLGQVDNPIPNKLVINTI